MHVQIANVPGGNFQGDSDLDKKWVVYAAKAIEFPMCVQDEEGGGILRYTAEPFKVWSSMLRTMIKERADQHGKQERLSNKLAIAD